MKGQKETTITSQEFHYYINKDNRSYKMKVEQISQGTWVLTSSHEVYDQSVEIVINVDVCDITNMITIEADNSNLELKLRKQATISPEESINNMRSLGWQLAQTSSVISDIWVMIDSCEKMKACGVDLLTIY